MRYDPARGGDDGFTLIELLVSLALFALISLAGLSLIETTIGVQQRTDGRSERLAQVQRALFLVSSDFEHLLAGPVAEDAAMYLTRGSGDGPYSVSYRAAAGSSIARSAQGTERTILSGVSAMRWRFFKDGAWTDQPVTEESPGRPRAVELTIEFAPEAAVGAGGSLRRVIELPAE